ncbi:MAG: hypothetical protein OHK0031_00320 [Anaerolineales bacterium]
MTSLIQQRVELARAGKNPAVLCKMPSGWAVMADIQILNGYCILLADPPAVSLNDLSGEARDQFLRDMALIGDALLEVTRAARINYEILGNSDPALHAHIIPRLEAEPAEYRAGPVWFYPFEQAPRFDPARYAALMEKIRAAILRRLPPAAKL